MPLEHHPIQATAAGGRDDRCRDGELDGGALLLAGGARGKRMALPNAKIQLWAGFEGEASDIEIQARETIAPTRRVEEPIAEHSGAALEKVSKDMQRDYFMSAEEAVAYGIIDGVLSRRFA